MSTLGSSHDRLLEAAITVIEAEGEAAVKVDRIAEMAGVTKPSIYHFFGDRDGLIVAAQAERFRRAHRQYEPTNDTMAPVLECNDQAEFAALVNAMVRSMLTPDNAARRRTRIQVLGSAISRPELHMAVQATHAEYLALFTRMFAYAQRRGWVRTDFSASSFGQWWYALITGRHMVDDYLTAAEAEDWLTLTLTAVAEVLGAPVDKVPAP